MSDPLRSFAATPARLRRARESGDYPLSHILLSGGSLIAAGITASAVASWTVTQFSLWLKRALAVDPSFTIREFANGIVPGILLIGSTAAGISLVIVLSQTHGQLLWGPRRHQRPAGARRAFTALFIGATGLSLLVSHSADVIRSSGDISRRLVLIGELGEQLLWHCAVVVALMAIVDLWSGHANWLEQHRMTASEHRQELRDQEGSPEVKRRRKQIAAQLAGAHGLTSPGHRLAISDDDEFCIVLGYDPSRHGAPIVLDHGRGPRASGLRRQAAALGIESVSNSSLTRRLSSVPLGQTVPEDTYAEIAALLVSEDGQG